MTALDLLADTLRLEPPEVARALGGVWTPITVVDLPTCFSAGSPEQVLLGWTDDGELVVAQPQIVWSGHRPETRTDKVHLQAWWPDLERIGEAVRAAVTAERRRLRWCRHCRELVSPGNRVSGDLCQGCASAFEGHVF